MIDHDYLKSLHAEVGSSAILPLISEVSEIVARHRDEFLACVNGVSNADLGALAHLRRGQAAMLGCTDYARALSQLEALASDARVPREVVVGYIEDTTAIAIATVAALAAYTQAA
jgi:hypothetical protein